MTRPKPTRSMKTMRKRVGMWALDIARRAPRGKCRVVFAVTPARAVENRRAHHTSVTPAQAGVHRSAARSDRAVLTAAKMLAGPSARRLGSRPLPGRPNPKEGKRSGRRRFRVPHSARATQEGAMQLGKLGVWVSMDGMTAGAAAEFAKRVEGWGYG